MRTKSLESIWASELAMQTCHSLGLLVTPVSQAATSPLGGFLCGFLHLTVNMSSTNKKHTTANWRNTKCEHVSIPLYIGGISKKKTWSTDAASRSRCTAWSTFHLYSRVLGAFLPVASPSQRSGILRCVSPTSLLSSLSSKGEMWHFYHACGQLQHLQVMY